MGKSGKGYLAAVVLIALSAVLTCRILSSAVTVIAVRERTQGRHTVVIDAGHGGIDGGATSCTGRLESGYNLEISLRLRDLMNLLGYRTKMVRTTDTSVYTSGNTIASQKMSDLKQRVRIACESPNNILVSIHQNNFSDPRYSGAQVFYAETDGSRLLAEAMQNRLHQALNPTGNRKIKKAEGIYLMQHITVPGILVECGFLSHPEEAEKLGSPDYQKKVSCVIACTLAEFMEKEYANT